MRDIIIVVLFLLVGWLAFDDMSNRDALTRGKADLAALHDADSEAEAGKTAQAISDLRKKLTEAKKQAADPHKTWVQKRADAASGALEPGAQPASTN
jgi:hypothetical protein